MKPTLLLGCALLAGTAAHAQLSLLPYAGFEQSRNTLGYGYGLSAADINGNIKAGLKLDYRLRGGHSPFLNLTTSPAPVWFRFDNSGSLVPGSEAVKGSRLFRMEAGYQYSSQPISFGKKRAAGQSASGLTQSETRKRTRCGLYMPEKSRCGQRRSRVNAAPANQPLNMRLQPSLALAYVPSAPDPVKQTGNGFEYATGTWKTAVVPAMGFEFAKGNRRLFTLGVFYTRPLAQDKQRVSTVYEAKTYVTNLSPKTTTWGVTLGVPFGGSRSKAATQKTPTHKCGTKTYYKRCMRLQ